MNNWLDEFTNSRVAKRVVFANYLSHLRLRNEGRETYANVEEALEDFARRTGLNEMQKRALRRQMFVKIAVGLPPTGIKNDMERFQAGDAPAAILPGVKPGSGLAKSLEKTRKKPFSKLTDLGLESQQANRDVENDAQQKSPHSNDESSVADTPSQMASYRPGIVIEAAEEEDPLAKFEEPKKTPLLQFKQKEKKPKHGPGGSREKKILQKIMELQNQLVSHFMEPGGSVSKPKWKQGLSPSDRKKKIDIQSDINEFTGELADLRFRKKEKEEVETPKNKAAQNNIVFLQLLNKELSAKTKEERKKALQGLSPEGLQSLYDTAVESFQESIYYKPSQGYDAERGDFVKCMVCDKHGKRWFNQDNPGILPFSHLETHATELLSDVDLSSTETGKYREEILNAYLRRFPGAALQSREQELASFLEKLVEKTADRPLAAPHVATKSEKELTYTDNVLLDMILHQFRRFGVDPDDKTLDDLAKETLEEIKGRLNEEFPGSLREIKFEEEKIETSLGEVGKLEDKKIPFEAFHRAFREEVGRISEEYKGTFSDFKPITRRPKRRWTRREREEVRQEHYKQLRREDIVRQLATELGRQPTEQEVADRLRELNMIMVGISVTGGRGCWNCGQKVMVPVENSRIGVNSVTCPNCGVYREVLVEVDKPEWEQKYVIRDPNENDPGGSKVYIIFEDPDFIGDGSRATGPSRFIHILGRGEQEVWTRVVEPGQEQPTKPLTVGTAVTDYTTQRMGRVAWVEGSSIWVIWTDEPHGHIVKIKDSKDEVIRMDSRDPNRAGAYQIKEVNIDYENGTAEVVMFSTTGQRSTRFYDNLQELETEIIVADKIDQKQLERTGTLALRRHTRQKLVNKIAQESEKSRYITYTVIRYTKDTKPVKQTTVSRIDLLERKIRRAQVLRRLLKGAN